MRKRSILVVAITAFVVAAASGAAVSAPGVLAGDKSSTDTGTDKGSKSDTHATATQDNDVVDVDGNGNNVSIVGAAPPSSGGDGAQDNDIVDVDGDNNNVNVDLGDGETGDDAPADGGDGTPGDGGDGAPDDGDNGMDGDANVTIDNCTDALVDTNLSNSSVEVDVLNLVTGDTDTLTVPLNGPTTLSLDEDQSLLGNQTGVDLDTATITEVRVLDENGDVVAVDSNDDIAACVEVLGLEVADIDTELALQLSLLTDGLNDGNLTIDDIANLTAGLNDTEIEALNEAIDTSEISQDELVNLATLRENGDLTADEFGSALLSGDVAQAIDDLLTSLL